MGTLDDEGDSNPTIRESAQWQLFFVQTADARSRYARPFLPHLQAHDRWVSLPFFRWHSLPASERPLVHGDRDSHLARLQKQARRLPLLAAGALRGGAQGQTRSAEDSPVLNLTGVHFSIFPNTNASAGALDLLVYQK